MRSIWLEDLAYHKLTFAKSLWPAQNLYFQEFKEEKPIGELLIKYNKDIYKDISEIYYGYSKYLNNYFKSTGPIWGRKYTIYYKKYYIITIHEFFSPELVNFFNIKI